MALTQTQCTSFKVELAKAIHDFTASTGDVFKIALFTATDSITGTYNADTTNYSDMVADEVVGTGYTAGGIVLTNITPVADDTTAVISFSPASWASSTLTSCGAMIYNSSKSNRAVCILAFGADKSSNDSTFLVTFPPATADASVLRIA